MFGVPGGEDAQPVVGGGARVGGPGDQLLVGVGGAGQCFPVEGEFADERVVQGFGAEALAGDVVGGPPLAELLILHGQLADQCR